LFFKIRSKFKVIEPAEDISHGWLIGKRPGQKSLAPLSHEVERIIAQLITKL
jgi:hypothetical protein